MSIESVNRVAMRKLSSSKIFDLTFYITDISGELRVERNHQIKKCSLSDLNRLIKERLIKRVKAGLDYLGRGGWVSKQEILNKFGESKVIYGVGHIDDDGEFNLFSENKLYIRIATYSHYLSGEDLVEVLRLGLELEKYSRHFKKL